MKELDRERLNRIKTRFADKFGCTPKYIVRAPGRVNLIGEHTDYNHGFVLPAAIDRDITIAASVSNAKLNEICVYSANYSQLDRFPLNDIQKSKEHPWSNYIRAVASVWQKHEELPSLNLVIDGDIPQGAGLSSSAAYEVAVATLLNQISGSKLPPKEIALIAQKAENDFVGVACGIMDQFVSVHARQDSALFIDCRSLAHESIAINLQSQKLSLLIVHSGIERQLVSSQYNSIRRQCFQGAEILAKAINKSHIHSLRDIGAQEFLQYQYLLPHQERRRCLHVIEENERVLNSVQLLRSGNITAFGQLMNQSHFSLRDKFGVSCHEMDLLVSLSQEKDYVTGARMTGAGFGGCMVCLVKSDCIRNYKENVIAQYERQTNRSAKLFVCQFAKGAHMLESPEHSSKELKLQTTPS